MRDACSFLCLYVLSGNMVSEALEAQSTLDCKEWVTHESDMNAVGDGRVSVVSALFGETAIQPNGAITIWKQHTDLPIYLPIYLPITPSNGFSFQRPAGFVRSRRQGICAASALWAA
jgi:hypothetical protein